MRPVLFSFLFSSFAFDRDLCEAVYLSQRLKTPNAIFGLAFHTDTAKCPIMPKIGEKRRKKHQKKKGQSQ